MNDNHEQHVTCVPLLPVFQAFPFQEIDKNKTRTLKKQTLYIKFRLQGDLLVLQSRNESELLLKLR